MSRLLVNSEPGERERGLYLSETFSSSANVTDNGGTQTGSPSMSNGVLTIDADNKYIKYESLKKPTTAITVMAWVYPTAAPDGTGRIIASDYDYVDGTNNLGWNFGDNYGSNDHLSFNVWDGAGLSATANQNGFFATYLNTWVHVAGVFEGGVAARLYFDGVLVDDDTAAPPATINYNSTFVTSIGVRADNTTTGSWRGDIKEVKMFDRALDISEILEFANNVPVDLVSGCVLNLPLSLETHDKANNQSLDLSGNANHAAFTNEPTKNTHALGYNFEGTVNYLTVTNDTTLNAASFTYSVWVRTETLGTNHVLTKTDGAAAWTRGWRLFMNVSNQFEFDNGPDGGELGNLKTDAVEGTSIHHLVITFINATTTSKLYMDGHLYATNTTAAFENTTVDDLLIGKWGANNEFDGDIFKVKSWNRALSHVQVNELYAKEKMELNQI
jgi:hypothetical protein|tara:strand:- start:545 stop:1873 length:1329 start_codon:yes stop_codon:yes gene_type:complete